MTEWIFCKWVVTYVVSETGGGCMVQFFLG